MCLDQACQGEQVTLYTGVCICVSRQLFITGSTSCVCRLIREDWILVTAALSYERSVGFLKPCDLDTRFKKPN